MLILNGRDAIWCRPVAFSYATHLVCSIFGHGDGSVTILCVYCAQQIVELTVIHRHAVFSFFY
jgi:hypothetical protein